MSSVDTKVLRENLAIIDGERWSGESASQNVAKSLKAINECITQLPLVLAELDRLRSRREFVEARIRRVAAACIKKGDKTDASLLLSLVFLPDTLPGVPDSVESTKVEISKKILKAVLGLLLIWTTDKDRAKLDEQALLSCIQKALEETEL